MNASIRRFCYLPVMVAACLIFGCNDKPKGDKIIVTGKVTLDDKPLEGVTLSFFGPDDKVASGVVVTQADGSYDVMFLSQAGEGNYKVAATKLAGGAGGVTITKQEGIDEMQMKLAAGSSGAASAIPLRYNDVMTSGLSTPLQKGKNEGKNFALKSK